jgi:hypothetical protein
VLEGAMNGETFKAYVEQFLAPTLNGCSPSPIGIP